MRSLADEVEGVDRLLADAMGPSGAGGGVRFADDAELLDVIRALGRVQRRLDGAVVAVTERIVARDACEREGRLSTRAGCRDAAEVLRRTLLVDGPAARRFVAAAGAVHRERDITSGGLLPGKFPALAAALADGFLSVGGFLACTVPLMKAARIGVTDRLAADAVLARFACGLALDGTDADTVERAPAPTVDELAALAAHIVARLDPDGAEPSDRAGKRRRHFTIGKLRDGSVPVRGELLPAVAAQLQKLIDSLLNPKAEDNGTGSTVRFRPTDDTGDGDRGDDNGDPRAGNGDGSDDSDDSGTGGGRGVEADGESGAHSGEDSNSGGGGAGGDEDGWFDAKYSSSAEYGAVEDASDRADGLEPHKAKSPPADGADMRTHAQKRHDAFATILMVAAASGGMPTLGGAAPTLVVSVTADDYAHRTGRARVEGTGYDVPLGAADHAACAGGVQRVLFDDKGAIVGISTSARLFNATQRRAIVLRDRECLIPGCPIPAEWCEIHHVEEHAHGGPTHTSNGVPLCWHHHTLDEGNWHIRIRDGLPEIRGPGWWDPYARWRSPHLDYQAVDETLNTQRNTTPEPAWNAW